jgi:hypothetical protein
VNSCKADDAAKATCAKATDAANQQPAKTGAQADAFNAAFNIKTVSFCQLSHKSGGGDGLTPYYVELCRRPGD